ncbi:MAG: hypothetical protein RLZZ171_2432 [Cyanobacteriota bacterium]|jgi:sulfur relay (sulfurtransferase) DsrC/TusE family protein
MFSLNSALDQVSIRETNTDLKRLDERHLKDLYYLKDPYKQFNASLPVKVIKCEVFLSNGR